MEAWKNTGQRSAVFFVLVLVMIFAMPGRVSAAWEKNTDGTYSWYQNGKLKKNSWISGTYYVNAKGIRSTGVTKIGKRYYYFGKSGAVIRNSCDPCKRQAVLCDEKRISCGRMPPSD